MSNSFWSCWDKSITIQNTKYTLAGFSIAALRTSFYIKELKIMFDAGLHAEFVPEVILVTHQHSDHCANLPYHLYSTPIHCNYIYQKNLQIELKIILDHV